jgi:hypothetical protein
MYYFVQNSESIRTAFADCLGGLLTVAAKDIVLYIHPAKGVSIKKVMTKFDHRIQTDCVEVSIGDMYSEESRNIQVLFTIPKLSAAQPTAAPIAHFTVKYIDAIRRFNLKLEADVEISRPNQKEIKEEEQTPQSMEIDEQRNRIIVADALDKATVLGNSYQHAQAKKELQSALDKLEVSISQTSPFTQGLIRDLRQAINHMDPSVRFICFFSPVERNSSILIGLCVELCSYWSQVYVQPQSLSVHPEIIWRFFGCGRDIYDVVKACHDQPGYARRCSGVRFPSYPSPQTNNSG